MWMMLQQEVLDDYVIVINEIYFIKEFLEIVFIYVNLEW